MNSSETEIIGHAPRQMKLVEVKRSKPRESWTNRTSTLVEKFCNYHDKICFFTEKADKCKERRQEEYKNRKIKNQPTSENIICRVCKKDLSSDNFYDHPTRPNGKDQICKSCKKEYDKKRNDQWPVLFRAAYRTSLRAHGNKEQLNSITLKECEELFNKQEGKCNHCRTELSCEQGTTIDCNYFRASLDRIDTSIVGYGNGNAQWLCVSCNKGKCTMPDEVHKAKFKVNEKLLKESQTEISDLKKQFEDKIEKLVNELHNMIIEVKELKQLHKEGKINRAPKLAVKTKETPTEKTCTKCLETQSLDNFNKKTDTADGYQPYCKQCISAAKKVSRNNHKESTFVCEHCEKVYQLKDSLTRHIKEKHTV